MARGQGPSVLRHTGLAVGQPDGAQAPAAVAGPSTCFRRGQGARGVRDWEECECSGASALERGPRASCAACDWCSGARAAQPQGRESAGYVRRDGDSAPTLRTAQGMALINHIFTGVNVKRWYSSNLRTENTGTPLQETVIRKLSVFVVETLHRKTDVAQRGELVNAAPLKRELLGVNKFWKRNGSPVTWY